jgi:hypothetical protein
LRNWSKNAFLKAGESTFGEWMSKKLIDTNFFSIYFVEDHPRFNYIKVLILSL